MFYIALCDDDSRYMEYLKKMLIGRAGLNPDAVLFYEYASGEELVKDFSRNIPYHLLILDMEMEQLDGDDTAREFRKKHPDALLVFCSGEFQPTVKSFEANAFRYLLKSYGSDEMAGELKVIIEEMEKRKCVPKIAVSYRDRTDFVRASDILYASIRKYGSHVHVYDGVSKKVNQLICNKSVSELYRELENFNFAYAHKSYFVNLQYVSNISNHQIELIDGTILTISKSKEKRFRESLALYLAGKY